MEKNKSNEEDLIKVDAPKQQLPPLIESLTNLISQAIWPIVGYLFHPTYLIVNSRTCDQLGHKYLAGFGLGSLTMGIMVVSIGVCYSFGMGTLVAQAAGAKNDKLCRTYLYRQYFLNTLMFILIAIPIPFLDKIYRAIGQDPEIAALACQYGWTVFPALYFHFQATSNVSFANSQKCTIVSF